MPNTWLANLSALISLLPAPLLLLRGRGRRDPLFWLLLGVGVAGPLAWAYAQMAGGWHTGISATLWVTIAGTMAVFAVLAIVTRQAWRLTPLLLPYLVLLGIMATIWHNAVGRPLVEPESSTWLQVHILVAVVAYGLLTVAAVAGLAVLLQERSIRAKRRTRLTGLLPSIADAERLQVRLLGATEAVLAAGLITGMANQYLVSGELLVFDHKILFVFATFVVIGMLLVAQYRTGVAGRRAARYVLLAYLLLTLGYPGVKFVSDVVMAAPQA